MPFDVHANLAISSVAVAPTPTLTGVDLFVQPGHGVRFPPPPFNATVWSVIGYPSPLTAEVVRVVGIVGDQLTVEREAEPGGMARDIQVGDMIAETITAKALLDIESGVNFPLIDTPGNVTSGGVVAAPGGQFTNVGTTTLTASQATITTVNAAEVTASASVSSPLGQFGSLGTTPLDAANLFGTVQDVRLSPNVLTHAGGYPGGSGTFLRADGTFALASGGAPGLHAATHYVGGSDPIVGSMAFSTLLLTDGELRFPLNGFVRTETLPGADGGQLALSSTGGGVASRGASILLLGNQNGVTDAGQVQLQAGDVATGRIVFSLGNAIRGQMHRSGGFSWGGLTDPGAGNLTVAGTIHADAGKRVLSVTGGFPGGTSTFLRSDGTFAVAAAAGVVPHASTHYDGGSDPIVGNISPLRVTVGEHLMVAVNIYFTGATEHLIGVNTVDGSDTGVLTLTGGPPITGGGARAARGAQISLNGNEAGGGINIQTGDVAGAYIRFQTYPDTARGQMHGSGGFSWGVIEDPGPANLLVQGTTTSRGPINANYTSGTSYAGAPVIVNTTTPRVSFHWPGVVAAQIGMDASGTVRTFDNPGTWYANFAAATLNIYGDSLSTGYVYPGAVTNPGVLQSSWFLGSHSSYGLYSNTGLYLAAGLTTVQNINCGTSLSVGTDASVAGWFTATKARASNCMVVGAGADPGPGILFIGAVNAAIGQAWVQIGAGSVQVSTHIGSAHNVCAFYNPNNIVGAIQTNGGGTTYLTTSDASLKRDHGRLTDTSVLERLVIHQFDWLADGQAGRGVFAQEAASVAPFATALVEGRWMVDYSKFVPDLIAGWQRHEARIAALEAQLRERN